jgi:hypothetical protein
VGAGRFRILVFVLQRLVVPSREANVAVVDSGSEGGGGEEAPGATLEMPEGFERPHWIAISERKEL